jgi:hypothetical protein
MVVGHWSFGLAQSDKLDGFMTRPLRIECSSRERFCVKNGSFSRSGSSLWVLPITNQVRVSPNKASGIDDKAAIAPTSYRLVAIVLAEELA